MGKLDGKAAVVTGAGRGLGRAYALRLAGLGANVAICDRDLRSFEEFERERAQMTAATTVEELRALGVDAFGAEVDVGSPEGMVDFAGQVDERWGHVDVLVCNAGGGSGALRESKASELDLEHLHAVMDRNLFGTIHTVLAVAPYMKRQRSGKIVTVSSQAGAIANEDGSYAHYGAAKAGIVMYTRYLAQDLGPYGITVNAIAPGYIGTGRLMVGFEEIGVESLERRVALRRIGTTEDCARVVEFLCTDLSDYVTGHVIPIDGGTIRAAS
jgi:3-oxoacyl-[acyl-carrier protein] reductase